MNAFRRAVPSHRAPRPVALSDSAAGHPFADVAAAARPLRFVCSTNSQAAGTTWIRLAGELDVATAPQLQHALSAALQESALVVLDLRELAFLGSAGVCVIVRTSIRARRSGRRVVLLRAAPLVDRMFALTGTRGDVEIVAPCSLARPQLPLVVREQADS